MLIEPHGYLVEAAHFRDNEMNYNIDTHGQQENKDSIKESNSTGKTDSRHSIDFTITTSNLENLDLNDDDIIGRIRSSNTKQTYILDYVYK